MCEDVDGFRGCREEGGVEGSWTTVVRATQAEERSGAKVMAEVNI